MIEFQSDLAQCFEFVDRILLWHAALRSGFPLPVLRMSLSSYSWPRYLIMSGLVSQCKYALRGIVAGSNFAAFLAGKIPKNKPTIAEKVTEPMIAEKGITIGHS